MVYGSVSRVGLMSEGSGVLESPRGSKGNELGAEPRVHGDEGVSTRMPGAAYSIEALLFHAYQPVYG